jgi:hypothetical protein
MIAIHVIADSLDRGESFSYGMLFHDPPSGIISIIVCACGEYGQNV